MILGGHFDIATKKNRLNTIAEEMNEPNFWNDLPKANKLNKEMSLLKKEVSLYDSLLEKINSHEEMLELLSLEYNDELSTEVFDDLLDVEKDVNELEINTLFNNEL